MIGTLWLQLADIYGQRFVNQYGETDHSGVWTMVLADLSEDDIRYGLMAMVRDVRFETWPPNCTQFRHLCTSRLNLCDQSLPSVHKAFREALNNLNFSNPVWSHNAIKFTVKRMGVDALNDARVDRAFKTFSTIYQRVSAKVLEGYQVPHVADEDVVFKRKSSKNIPRLSLLLSKGG